MRDLRKAEEIAALRVQLLSPLLADGLDPAKAREIKAQICEQTGLSERTIRRYLAQYRSEGFGGLKPKGKGSRSDEDAIAPHLLEKLLLHIKGLVHFLYFLNRPLPHYMCLKLTRVRTNHHCQYQPKYIYIAAKTEELPEF